MRSMILVAALLLAADAGADKAAPSTTGEFDKSSPAAADAQDYNSSRSNISTSVDRQDEGAENRDIASREKGPGMATGRRQHSADTTCSNRVDNDCEGVSDESASQGATRAQDYNSSRSNTTSARLDPDSDNDSILTEVRCSKTSDECTGIVDGDDRVVRKKPGKR